MRQTRSKKRDTASLTVEQQAVDTDTIREKEVDKFALQTEWRLAEDVNSSYLQEGGLLYHMSNDPLGSKLCQLMEPREKKQEVNTIVHSIPMVGDLGGGQPNDYYSRFCLARE